MGPAPSGRLGSKGAHVTANKIVVADVEDAALIVIGSLRDQLLGSISDRGTHLAHQPVTIITTDWRNEAA